MSQRETAWTTHRGNKGKAWRDDACRASCRVSANCVSVSPRFAGHVRDRVRLQALLTTARPSDISYVLPSGSPMLLSTCTTRCPRAYFPSHDGGVWLPVGQLCDRLSLPVSTMLAGRLGLRSSKRGRWERRDFLAFPPGRALLSVVLVIENLVEPLPVEVGPPVGPADG